MSAQVLIHFIVGENRCVAFEESLESLSAVGTISVVLTQALSHKIASKATTRKKMFREVGPVSESSMKGDLLSHTIRYLFTPKLTRKC